MDALKIQTLEKLLQELKPGFLPFPIFTQIARLVVLCTVEVAVFSYDSATKELMVLLTQRPADDYWWPHQWHAPGALFLATDPEKSLAGPLQRVQAEYGFSFPSAPIYLRSHFEGNERGAALSLQHYLLIDSGDKPGVGTYFPVNRLPDNLLAEHREYLHVAAETIHAHGL